MTPVLIGMVAATIWLVTVTTCVIAQMRREAKV